MTWSNAACVLTGTTTTEVAILVRIMRAACHRGIVLWTPAVAAILLPRCVR